MSIEDKIRSMEASFESERQYKIAKAQRERKAAEAQIALPDAIHRATRPHWSVTPGFIVGVLAMLFAAIAAWPVVREWFQASPPAHTDSSSPPPQWHLEPATLPARP